MFEFPKKRAFRRSSAVILVVLAATLATAGAAYGSGAAVIQDCQANDALTGHYSTGDLRSALAALPADIKEYSDCESIIAAALQNATLKKHLPKPPSPNAASSASFKKQLAKSLASARREVSSGSHGNPIDTAGTSVTLGPGRTLTSSVTPGIPGSLVFAIAGIVLLGALELGARARRKLRAHTDSDDQEL